MTFFALKVRQMTGKIMVPISDIKDLDLNKSGIIEASAGTGKTYTICTIVSQIIREGYAEADQIAVVTFTEKAAGELKQRIVKRLEDDLNECSGMAEAENLKNALARTDEIRIGTIHGFCNGLLHEFSFENGVPFKLNSNNDPALRDRLLNLQIRRDWQKTYGGILPVLLKASGFIDNPNGFIEDVGKIANKLYAFVDCGNRPENDSLTNSCKTVPEVQNAESLEAKLENLKSSWNEVRKLAAAAKKECGTSILKSNGKKVPSRSLDSVVKAAELCAESFDSIDLKTLSGTVGKNEKIYGYDNIEETDIYAFQNAAKKFLESYNEFAAVLKINTAVQLVKDFRTAKAENRIIGFDDMLILVYEALQNKTGGENLFCQELQQKFRYALLDEFQDTDQVQWGIFRTIFLDETSPGNKIYLIGDPKQAIYSFRNADINTYNLAKSEVIAAGGLMYNLGKNYRSVKTLVNGFNKLFSTEFFGKDGKITYINVDSQSEAEQKISIVQPEENTICCLTSESKTADSFNKLMKNFIVKEIVRLEKNIKIRDKNRERPLNLGDICILTRTNDGCRDVKNALMNAGIPADIYKETGIFRSDEALNVYCILDVLMFPGDESRLKKALLTEFYAYSASELENLTSEELWHKANLSSLQKIARRMEWSSFFAELFDCTGIFTNLLAKDTTADKNVASRKITDYRHIAEVLQENAYREKLNLEGMQKHLDSLRFLSDMDFFRKSGSQPMVQVMTIHASKGLEFPIVFVMTCRLKENKKTPVFQSYHSQNKLIIDTMPYKENAIYNEETAEEHNRLLYVAATRASCKLYLPIDYDALQIPDNAQKINLDEIPTDFVSRSKPQSECEKLPEEFLNVNSAEMERYFRLESFSSLAAKGEHIEQLEALFELDNDDSREEDEVVGKAGVVHGILPGGMVTGNMMHKIFELIDFAAAADVGGLRKNQIIASLTDRETEESKIIFDTINFYYPNLTQQQLELYADEAANIIYNVLNTPLSVPDGNSFCLHEISRVDRISEMNFYMSVPNRDDLQMTGSLDLVFRCGGKYYFLDWKTNSLENYADTSEYTDEHYAMQYKIYLQALKRFLSARLKGKFQYERDFGGIFYVYVRGVTPDNPKQGICFYKPNPESR